MTKTQSEWAKKKKKKPDTEPEILSWVQSPTDTKIKYMAFIGLNYISNFKLALKATINVK